MIVIYLIPFVAIGLILLVAPFLRDDESCKPVVRGCATCRHANALMDEDCPCFFCCKSDSLPGWEEGVSVDGTEKLRHLSLCSANADEDWELHHRVAR